MAGYFGDNVLYVGTIVKRARYRAEYLLLVACGTVFGMMPPKWVFRIVRMLGFFAFHVFRIRRSVTLDNLLNSFRGEKSGQELERIARLSYDHIGMTFIEMLYAPKLVPRIHEIVDLSDIEKVHRALERGNGLVLVYSHFGSWELNAGALAAAGIPTSVVVRRQTNPLVDRLMNRNRSLFGMKIIPTGVPFKKIVQALRNGESIGLASDQNAGRKGVFVDFFGQKTSTPRGAAKIALKYSAPVIVTVSVRMSPGRYRMILREVDVVPDDTVESLTQRYTGIMEEIIRQYPEQYFWMHRRWKTRPPQKSEG